MTKGKHSRRSIRNPSETRPGDMNSIDQMVSAQPGIIPQVTGDLTHARFLAETVFMDHYSDYCYTHLMKGTSAEENLKEKETLVC